MTIQERISKLELENKELKEYVDMLAVVERFVTPSELSEILKCSKNHIYIQIRKGIIQAVTLGSAIRIPMSQFQQKTEQSVSRKVKKIQDEPEHKRKTMQEIRNIIFD